MPSPLLLLALLGQAPAPAPPAPEPKVLLVFVDGFIPEAIANTATPVLDPLLATGAYSLEAVAESTAISGSGWSTFLTGVHFDKHGAPDNAFEATRYDEWPHLFRRLHAARPGAVCVSACTWKPIEDLLVAGSGADRRIFHDYDLTAGDHFGPKSCDTLAVRDLAPVLEHGDPDCAVMMFGELDGVGHADSNAHYDATDERYLRMVRKVDGELGVLLDAIRRRPSFAREDWLLVLSSDHGGSPGAGHGQNRPEHRRIPFLAAHLGQPPAPAHRGPLWPPPTHADVAPTALAHLLGAVDPAWGLDGRPRGLAPEPPRPLATLDANLLFNGDAEATRGYDGYQGQPDAWCLGWEDHGWLTAVRYGAPGGFPSVGDALPAAHGAAFFAGGNTTERSTMAQTVALAPLREDLAAGCDFSLSAWLGGYLAQPDRASLSVEFLGADHGVLGTAELAAVTAEERLGRTGFRRRATSGAVPPGAAWARVTLTCEPGEGLNDGYADGLSLVLTRRAP